MKDKIRFLATGDIHSRKDIIKNIKKYNDLSKIDYILLTGDLSEKKNDFKKILEIFENKPILMVRGNHESKKQLKILESKYNIHILDKSSKQIHNDLIIFGPTNINVGPNSKNEDEIYNKLIERFEKIKNIKCKLFLSHIPPENTKITMATPFYPYIGGSFAIEKFLKKFKIDLTLVGHIHESGGLEEMLNSNKIINIAGKSKILEFNIKNKKIEILN